MGITIDGSYGEGGGQILRTSLAMSLVTGTPFRIERIRAGRARPGILRQHLTAVKAAAEVGSARVTGAEIGSAELTFEPGAVKPGQYRFAVGTAGSATLVLQTVLPALVLADGPSSLVLEGGTHNPFAPPWDYLDRAFLPLLNRMGPTVTTRLERYGFYPAGGGRFTVEIAPRAKLEPLEIVERGALASRRARALVANLPESIAHRETGALLKGLSLSRDECRAETVSASAGPGNILMLELCFEHLTEVFTGFGEKGVSAEKVADFVADEARAYLRSDAPVGQHLADQLLVPMAIAGAGRFRTVKPSGHTTTNVDVLKQFTGIEVEIGDLGDGVFEVSVGRAQGARSADAAREVEP